MNMEINGNKNKLNLNYNLAWKNMKFKIQLKESGKTKI